MPSGRQLFTFHFSLFTLHFLLSPSGESVGGQTKKNCQRCERWQLIVYISIKMFRRGKKEKSRFRFILLVFQQEFQLRRKQGKKERSEHQSVQVHSAQ